MGTCNSCTLSMRILCRNKTRVIQMPSSSQRSKPHRTSMENLTRGIPRNWPAKLCPPCSCSKISIDPMQLGIHQRSIQRLNPGLQIILHERGNVRQYPESGLQILLWTRGQWNLVQKCMGTFAQVQRISNFQQRLPNITRLDWR